MFTGPLNLTSKKDFFEIHKGILKFAVGFVQTACWSTVHAVIKLEHGDEYKPLASIRVLSSE
jgi:hypothetical protein